MLEMEIWDQEAIYHSLVYYQRIYFLAPNPGGLWLAVVGRQAVKWFVGSCWNSLVMFFKEIILWFITVSNEGRNVIMCVCACVCVLGRVVVGGPGSDSVVSESSPRWEMTTLSFGLCGRCGLSRRGLCSDTVYGVLRSLQASGCSFMLLCLRNHVTMHLPHTVFISVLWLICTKVSRGNWGVHFWNTYVYVKKQQQKKQKVKYVFYDSVFLGYMFLFFQLKTLRFWSNILHLYSFTHRSDL